MTKTIYIAVSRRIRGDSFDLLYTFDPDEARKACADDWDHLTASERKGNVDSVDGYTVEVLEGETAAQAFKRLLDEDELPCDPDYYEEYKPEA